MMQSRRTHYFPADDCRVITGLLPNGQYGARMEDDEHIRGMGHTRLAAIADLSDALDKMESIYEREPIMVEAAQ